jgi:hypothetical protein
LAHVAAHVLPLVPTGIRTLGALVPVYGSVVYGTEHECRGLCRGYSKQGIQPGTQLSKPSEQYSSNEPANEPAAESTTRRNKVRM